jgi:hypothetical protein
MSSILPTVYNVRKWAHVYHELTVWSRGIIMDKEARDVSSVSRLPRAPSAITPTTSATT